MNDEMNPLTGNNRIWEEKQEAKRKREELKHNREKQKETLNIERQNTLSEYQSKIGKQGTIKKIDGLTIKVIAKDFKQSFGHFRYLVTPLAGTGEIWTQKVIFD